MKRPQPDQEGGGSEIGDDLGQQFFHLAARHLIKSAEGFVEQQHLGFAGQANGRAPCYAAGKGRG
jgi:hypothetical protein